jgi:hypothetical protein
MPKFELYKEYRMNSFEEDNAQEVELDRHNGQSVSRLEQQGVSKEEFIAVAKNTAELANKFMDYKVEHERTVQITAQYKAQERVAITEIREKYSTIREIFSKAFAERRSVIDKNFEVIDRGLQENDYNLISMGLSQLSNVVTTSPFANLVSFHNLLESDDDDAAIKI